MPELHPWEFLIQLDGDRAWLPLNAPNVEVLEGRYRIAAKSKRKNAPVEVRIQHDALNELPPKRRTQTRTHQTNQRGLMVVIPFTRLQPGRWEFQCVPEAGTAHSIQLQVLSIESDIVEDWNPDWDNADPAAPEFTSRAAETKVVESDSDAVAEFLRQAEQESGSIADEILNEYNLVSEVPYQDQSLPPTVGVSDAIVSIALAQETYIAHRGEPLSIVGKIISEQTTHLDAELRVCLRDPQNSETLLDTGEILHQVALPFDLFYQFTLPVELQTQLILGEIILFDPKVEGKPTIATQPFTVMADVNELLDALHQAKADDRAMAEDMLDLPAAKSAAHPALNLAFLDLVAAPKDPEAVGFTAKETPALPPQLHQPNPYLRKKLDLPSFGIQPDAAIPEYTPPESTQLEIPLTGSFASLVPSIEAPEAFSEPDAEEPTIEPLAPVEEPAIELKVQADDRDANPELEEAALNLQPSPDQIVDEFVVDDEPILPLADLMLSRRQKLVGSSERAQNPLLLPEHEPVPDPVMTIAEAELIGGKTTIVHLRLPDILPKVYVKVWVNDRQNRTMIESSRWVIDFKPDGHGNLEATTELKVPLDSVEIQIEAIAVEVMTNRESHKVTLDLRIVSEQLPDLWFDDLDADSVVSL
ncbi:MAG TPA: hypothetical protein VL134_08265 [Leptolyngbya sp.]|jgi:hypothetical protein|nr:hypothetical protein [Leptolyngbya sp.]